MESRITTMKNSLEGLQGKFEQAERISKLEDRIRKITESEGQGKKRECEKRLRDPWNIVKWISIHILGVTKKKIKRKGQREDLKK